MQLPHERGAERVGVLLIANGIVRVRGRCEVGRVERERAGERHCGGLAGGNQPVDPGVRVAPTITR